MVKYILIACSSREVVPQVNHKIKPLPLKWNAIVISGTPCSIMQST